MELTEEEAKLRDEACGYISERKDELLHTFILSKNPLQLGFITIFMAGSPGSGKTEFSQRYLPILMNLDGGAPKRLKELGIDPSQLGTFIVRIDVDEIREFLPQYRRGKEGDGKGNAHVIQSAANKGLDMLRDYCFENEISFLHDGTFGNLKTMRELIRRSLATKREVQIYYLYLDPLTAWDFTKAREFIEGRNILKDKFIDQYYSSRENVDAIKSEFKGKVKIHCVLKNVENQVEEVAFNVPSIDSYLRINYTKGKIRSYSREELLRLLDK